jgi:hypothetical protein
MTTMKLRLAALGIGLAVAAIASPSFAQNPYDNMSAARVAALTTFSTLEQRFLDYLWGIQEVQIYRSCMARRNQWE